MADSQLILELLFLNIRGGCSFIVLIFFNCTNALEDMLLYSYRHENL